VFLLANKEPYDSGYRFWVGKDHPSPAFVCKRRTCLERFPLRREFIEAKRLKVLVQSQAL